MLKWTYFVIVIGIACVFFLLTRRQEQPHDILVLNQTDVHVVEQKEEPKAKAEAIRLRYVQPEDPLLYVDDGMYYKNPLTIEGNRLWVEQRPKTNDLEWGMPLYTDRWSGGVYNGSYKTYSS